MRKYCGAGGEVTPATTDKDVDEIHEGIINDGGCKAC